MNEHFKLLGFKVRDVITGFEGIVDSISFDLYGCVQAIVRAEQDKKKPNETPASYWFDLKRLRPISKTPVMAVPSFVDVPGGADKPAYPSKPAR